MYSFPNFEPVHWSMFRCNCCFLTCIQVFQETGEVIWYSHLFKNFPRFVGILKGRFIRLWSLASSKICKVSQQVEGPRESMYSSSPKVSVSLLVQREKKNDFSFKRASLTAQLVKHSPAMQETPVQFLAREDPLEKG